MILGMLSVILKKSNIFRLMAHRLHDEMNVFMIRYLGFFSFFHLIGPDNYDYHAFLEMMKLFEIFKIFLKNCLIMVDI